MHAALSSLRPGVWKSSLFANNLGGAECCKHGAECSAQPYSIDDTTKQNRRTNVDSPNQQPLHTPHLQCLLECVGCQALVALHTALRLTPRHIRAGQQLLQLPLLPGLLNGVTQLGDPQAALVDIIG